MANVPASAINASRDYVNDALKMTPNVSGVTTLTITSGSITPAGAIHKVAVEGGVGPDDLDTIDGAAYQVGFVLFLKADDPSKVVTLTHNVGNLRLRNDESIALDDERKLVMLFWDGTNWVGGTVGGGKSSIDAVDVAFPNASAPWASTGATNLAIALNRLTQTGAERGAELIGVTDADDNFQTDNVEAALKELADKVGDGMANGYLDFSEITTPSNPTADKLRVYARDEGGVSKFFYRDSAGNETEIGAAGASAGGANPNQVIAADNGIVFDGTDQYAAFKAFVEAQTAGTQIVLSRGTLGLNPTSEIYVPDGVTFIGAGMGETGTVINLLGPVPSGGDGVFETGDETGFEEIHFKAVAPAVPDSQGSGIFIKMNSSNFYMIRTSCDMGYRNGTTALGRMQFILWRRVPAPAAKDKVNIVFHENRWEYTWRIASLFFGPTASPAGPYSFKRVIITNNIIRDCGNSGFVLQDPEGGTDGVPSQGIIFSNNIMEDVGYPGEISDGAGGTNAVEGIGFGAASTSAVLCTNNVFLGASRNWVSLEQHANRWIISNNAFWITANPVATQTRGIIVYKWNASGDGATSPGGFPVAGAADTPEGITCVGNTILMRDRRAANTIGILVTNAPPNEALEKSVIANNNIHGCQYGIATRDVAIARFLVTEQYVC